MRPASQSEAKIVILVVSLNAAPFTYNAECNIVFTTTTAYYTARTRIVFLRIGNFSSRYNTVPIKTSFT